ncbi:MAG: radical SAM protein [Patescibacteria group bacterium]|nr:radical SAM protein [Patescibacteria group bacterium]
MKTEIVKTQAKEIYTKTKLPGSDYVINQYVGCGHACSYCYARFISRWKGYQDWGNWVEAKMNAPELVKNKYVPGWVFMSSISDAYQPVEKELLLTRKVLKNMDKKINLSILTKSDLVLRDIDLLKKFKEVEVGFTLNSFEGKEKELFEPNSPTFEQRIKALKTLKENGIKTYAFVAPIIPGLINLDKVVSEAKKYSDYFWFEVINLRGAGKEFSEILEKEYPESFKIIKDKKLFNDFIQELQRRVKKYQIKVKGIELH